MDEQNFTHPQQVRDFLAATIGEEVFNTMAHDDVGRDVGNPYKQPVAQPVAAPQQVPAQADPTQPTPQAAPAQPQPVQPAADPHGERLVLGKFKSEAEAEKSYHGLIHANKALLSKQDQLEASLSELQARVNGQFTPAPSAPVQADPVSRSSRRAEIETSLAENPFDTKLITELAQVAAQEVIDKANAPQRAYAEADSYMQANHPDAFNYSEEVRQFVATTPKVKAAVQELWDKGAYGHASELAWLNYQIAGAAGAEQAGRANAEVLNEEREKARIDAGLVTSQASGVHETPASKQVVSKEQEEQAIRQFHAGYKQPLLRIIGKDLPDDVFGPN